MSSRGASTRSGRRFDIDRKRARVELIERESVQPGFWDDQKRAQALSKEKSGLELQLAQYERERQRLDDAIALHELAEEANDAATWEEAKLAMAEAVQGAQRLELSRMLGGPQDHLNAIVEINAGAGGTESQDWALMLFRMYTRYCERKGWKWSWAISSPARRRGSRTPPSSPAATTPTGGSKRKSGCTGWCASRPSTPTRGGTPRFPASSSIPRSTKTSTSISIPTTCASTPSGPPARAARKSTRPTRPSA